MTAARSPYTAARARLPLAARRWRVSAALCLSVIVGCGEDPSEDTAPGDDGLTTMSSSSVGTASESEGSSGPVLDIGDSTSTGSSSSGTTGDAMCPCGNNADLIYVLSDNQELYTYNPPTNQFTPLGNFSCPAPALDTTFSMGVARSGTAWVMYSPSGDIFHVDVNNANQCSDPGYTPGGNNFTLFGMAFASQSAVDPCDKLYAHSFSGGLGGFSEGPNAGRLGRLDSATATPVILGPIDYDGGELTGTGDGRLFAFAGLNPAKLIEYDKNTGAVLQTLPLGTLELTNAFAFAFWGGDFYFFTEADALGTRSKVTRLDFDGDMSLQDVNTNAPIRIVGAGVSTCAPFTPPG